MLTNIYIYTMQHIEEFVSGWQWIELGRQKLQTPSFENVVFRFVEICSQMPQNSKVLDYQRALESFRVHYYNEFLYKCRHRDEQCSGFIETLSAFSDKTKVHKKDYVSLFGSLRSYYSAGVGGTKNGIPLLSFRACSLRDAPPYYVDWCYDQVQSIRKEMGLESSASTGGKAKETLLGKLYCPAACLPVSVGERVAGELIAQYLERTKPFLLPEASAPMQQYLSEVFQVCSRISTEDSESCLRYIQLSLQARSAKLVSENKRLREENLTQNRKLKDLEIVQRHIVEDNEETRISLRAVHDERDSAEHKFRQCERAFYELRRCHEEQLREMSSLKRLLDESIKGQWAYYNQLKRHGLVG